MDSDVEKHGILYFKAKRMLGEMPEADVRTYFKKFHGDDYFVDQVLNGHLKNKGQKNV
jgi:hypothetical protein